VEGNPSYNQGYCRGEKKTGQVFFVNLVITTLISSFAGNQPARVFALL